MGGVVPLSEHEQRQLEQIEQALYSEDPKFVHAVRSSDPRVHYKRRALQASIGFVVGVGLLVSGLILTKWPLSIAGFVVMLVCAMWALTSYRHISAMSAAAGLRRPRNQDRARRRQQRKAGIRVAQPGMMERLEERWRRRQERGL
jgi:hypothetical protein